MNAIPKINQKSEYFSQSSAGAGSRPLVHPRTLIGLSRRRLCSNDILKLIDARQIRWAWDISRPGSRRPEVRIWRESLMACLAREGDGTAPPPDRRSLAQVIAAILPRPEAVSRRAATVRGRELQGRFMCSQMLIRRLIADGELSAAAGFRGGKSPEILYQSVFEFLKRRSLSV
jgi:hypothetical protein